MQIVYATEAVPGAENEDLVVAGPSWIVVLDGAIPMPDRFPSGCIHSVPWLARHLGSHLARELTLQDSRPLTDILAASIAATVADHADTCDMTNPDSPSSTVSIVRERGDQLEYLVLCDSPIVVDHGDGKTPTIIKDSQIRRLSDYSYEGVSRARNSDGGFWVASTKPEAAYHGVWGSLDRRNVQHLAVLTDGASRLVEKFATMDWDQLLHLVEKDGPQGLIEATRAVEAEYVDQPEIHKGKPNDDATAALLTM